MVSYISGTIDKNQLHLRTFFLLSNGSESILTVIYWPGKMAHFIPGTENTGPKKLAELILRDVWQLHITPKTIGSSIFIAQVTTKLIKHLDIILHTLAAYHLKTDRKSWIANNTGKQYICCFTQYFQHDWKTLLPTAKFLYRNNNHVFIGVSFQGKLLIQPHVW